MFLPISRSIYCGALSPSALEGHRCTDECLRKDARRLAVLPARLPELTERLADVLRNYGVDFPPFPAVSLLTEADSCDTDFYSPLSLLRGDELDSMLRLSTDMEMLTPTHAFYVALLRAEAHWLKLSLEEQIARLRSDNDALAVYLAFSNANATRMTNSVCLLDDAYEGSSGGGNEGGGGSDGGGGNDGDQGENPLG